MKKRNNYTPEFKAKIALEAIRCDFTISELGSKYEVHPSQITRWKNELIGNAKKAFNNQNKKKTNSENDVNHLYKQIGKLKVENDFLREKLIP